MTPGHGLQERVAVAGRGAFVFLEVLAVPSPNTTVVAIRVPDALAKRVKATAAYSGRTPNKFVNDILAAMFGEHLLARCGRPDRLRVAPGR